MKAGTIRSVSVQHCLRDANQVAHELARYAYDSKESRVWDGDPPGFIFHFLVHDVTMIPDE